jgi:hypothetical protein
MDYTIKDVYEQGGILRVIVDHDYGTSNIGLNLASKKLDPNTDKPKYLSEIKSILQKRYGDSTRKRIEVPDHVGETFTVDGINPGIYAWFDELVAVKGIGNVHAREISNLYTSKDALVSAIKSGVKLSFDKNINEILVKIYGVSI